jgi:putative transposase
VSQQEEGPPTVARGGLAGAEHSPRKRAGVSSIQPVAADAPNVVWAIDFQFDSTVDGRAIKIASMIDEHTRRSPLHVVERSITAERLVIEREDAFAVAGGPPKLLRMDNGPELVSQALQRFCDGKAGLPTSHPESHGTTATSNRSTTAYGKECLNRNHWNTLFAARVVIGDFKKEHNHRHRHSALGYRTPAEYAARCRCTHTRRPESGTKQPDSRWGLISIGDLPLQGSSIGSVPIGCSCQSNICGLPVGSAMKSA